MWRDTNPKTNETNRCGGIRYTPIGKAFDLEEPDFDVMALMLSVFYKTDAYRERRNEAYRHLREAVTPPVLNRPKTIAVPTIEERELARKQREHVRETLRQNGHVKIEKPTEMNVLDNGTGEILCEEYGEKMAAIKSKRKGAATEGGV